MYYIDRVLWRARGGYLVPNMSPLMISGTYSRVIMLSTRGSFCDTFSITNRPGLAMALQTRELNSSHHANLARMEREICNGVVDAAYSQHTPDSLHQANSNFSSDDPDRPCTGPAF